MATELVFMVEEAAEGGFVATCLQESIVTEADDWEGLKANVLDAVRCHFGDQAASRPVIRMHRVIDEVLAA